MVATPQQIRDRAANDLGLLRLGQALQDQDKTRIEAAYAEVWAALDAEKLASWSVSADVPDAFAPHVIALVAANCLSVYGVSAERFQRLRAEADAALPAIRQLVASSYAAHDGLAKLKDRVASTLKLTRLGQTLRDADAQRIADAYREVYYAIATEGIADWGVTATDIPEKLMPWLVALVAANCLPDYPVPTETRQEIMANASAAPRMIRMLQKQAFQSADNVADY